MVKKRETVEFHISFCDDGILSADQYIGHFVSSDHMSLCYLRLHSRGAMTCVEMSTLDHNIQQNGLDLLRIISIVQLFEIIAVKENTIFNALSGFLYKPIIALLIFQSQSIISYHGVF